MLRFSIRDLLWLMLIVALICMVVIRANDQQPLQEKLRDLQESVEQYQKGELIFKRELERLTGKRVTGWRMWTDTSEPGGVGSSVTYANDKK